MLDTIVETLYILKDVTNFSVLCSYKLGQTIVFILTFLFEAIVTVVNSIQTLSCILFEDFRHFWGDVIQLLIICISAFANVAQTFVDIILNVVHVIKVFVYLIVAGAANIVANINDFFSLTLLLFLKIFVSIKQCLVLLGSSIVLIITLLPLFITYIFTMSTYYVGALFNELLCMPFHLVNYLKPIFINIYNFIFDFPIDSLLGLMFGVSVIFIILKMQIALNLFVRSVFVRMRIRLFNFGRQNTNIINQNLTSTASQDKNHFCVICQERDKCILMLPCKHLCVCNVCNIKLQCYHHACPICRTIVQKTIKVFT